MIEGRRDRRETEGIRVDHSFDTLVNPSRRARAALDPGGPARRGVARREYICGFSTRIVTHAPRYAGRPGFLNFREYRSVSITEGPVTRSRSAFSTE